ncbi:MAG: hypothetical protein K0U49_11640 [Alphaproteobacteria bacterium]|nr:hypothetical protein [Alphaproteobacteria bacterium]
MSTTIKLSDADALTEQVRHAAAENPDLPYEFIKDILLAKQEQSVPFNFDKE